ncbi:MAG: hypothetical protein ABSA50_12575 [Candidatus Bathyarchaeia archaeon]
MRTTTPIVVALLIAILAITAVGGAAIIRTHAPALGQTNQQNQPISGISQINSPHPGTSNSTPQPQRNQTCNNDDGCSSGDD